MDVSAHQEEDPLTDAESLHIWGVFSRGLDPDDKSHAKKDSSTLPWPLTFSLGPRSLQLRMQGLSPKAGD